MLNFCCYTIIREKHESYRPQNLCIVYSRTVEPFHLPTQSTINCIRDHICVINCHLLLSITYHNNFVITILRCLEWLIYFNKAFIVLTLQWIIHCLWFLNHTDVWRLCTQRWALKGLTFSTTIRQVFRAWRYTSQMLTAILCYRLVYDCGNEIY